MNENDRKVAHALNELMRYRAIGTVEECRNAVERMKPKKVVDYNEGETQIDFICPSCSKAAYGQPYKPNNCKHCGQALDWQ